MSTNPIPAPRELLNKPLVEAIFELRWALRIPGSGLPPQDPGFRIALGRFYDKVRKDYPELIDLPTSQVPEDMTAYTVRHQFRRGKGQWPLTQLGPGILTVNDTNGYTWDSFRPKVLDALDAIFNAYPADIHPFKPSSLRLRYIDAIDFSQETTDPINFLEEYLHTRVVVEPLLFDNPGEASSVQQLRLSLTFPLTKPKGVGVLGFANSARHGKPSIIMEIVIRSEDDNVPSSRKDFPAWVNDAHAVVDKWFFTLCRGQLLERFEEAHADA